MSGVASLLLHLLAALLFLRIVALLDHRTGDPMKHDAAQVITIEKRLPVEHPHAAPAVKHLQPKPQVVPSPLPVVVRPHELTSKKIVANAPPVERPAVAVPVRQSRPQLSAQQIARIESNMAGAIAEAKAGIDPVRVPPAAIAPPKRFAPDFAAFDGTLGRHHGLCDPTTSWKDDGWDYYYVSCNVHFPDGHVERQPVPWPIRFEPSDDPFAGTTRGREKPLAAPLPGWHLEPGQTVSEQLRDYAHSRGVDIP